MVSSRIGVWAGVTLAGLALLAGCKSQSNTTASGAPPESTMTSPAAETSGMAAPGGSTMSPGTAAPSGAAPGAAALADPQIAQIALSADAGDSARGKLAETKATNAEVKSFAREMVTDHTMLNKKATELAKKLNVTPQASDANTDLLNKVQGMTQDLQSKTGKDFDKTYMDQEVQIHQLVLDDLDKNLIPGAQNAELKSLLTTARGVVDGHLKRAQAIDAKLK